MQQFEEAQARAKSKLDTNTNLTSLSFRPHVAHGYPHIPPINFRAIMVRIVSFLSAIFLSRYVLADVAPDITTVQDGYNLIAKIPCLGCPFLYQDTSKGSNEPWTERQDENALVRLVNFPCYKIQTCVLMYIASQHQPPIRQRLPVHQQRTAPFRPPQPPPHLRQPSFSRHIDSATRYAHRFQPTRI